MYRINQIKERLSLPCFISFLKASPLLLFFFVSSNALSAKDLKEYYIEVIVFEQLEITQEEDLSPVLLDLKSKNLISLLERQANKINTEAVEKSFEAKVSGDLLNNLEIIDLESPSIIEPDDAKEEKKYILQTDKWFERSDQLKELNNIYRRLDRRNEYKVLHKISWIQPALPDEETPYVHEIFDTHGLLIRLYQSRYLHLDLIGSGVERANLESFVTDNKMTDLVKFHPWMGFDEFMSLISESFAFIHPARFDAFGGSIFGMACGVPVIGSSGAGAVKERVVHGMNGLIYDDNNPDTLANLIHELVNDPVLYEKLRIGARRTAKQWTPQVVAKKVIESLNSIPNLESLYINLHEEEQVDLVMRILTDLQYLNGLPVERDMLEDESQESEMKEVVVNEVSQIYSASRTVEDEEVLKINNTAART